jgi:hypothetical protein
LRRLPVRLRLETLRWLRWLRWLLPLKGTLPLVLSGTLLPLVSADNRFRGGIDSPLAFALDSSVESFLVFPVRTVSPGRVSLFGDVRPHCPVHPVSGNLKQ